MMQVLICLLIFSYLTSWGALVMAFLASEDVEPASLEKLASFVKIFWTVILFGLPGIIFCIIIHRKDLFDV